MERKGEDEHEADEDAVEDEDADIDVDVETTEDDLVQRPAAPPSDDGDVTSWSPEPLQVSAPRATSGRERYSQMPRYNALPPSEQKKRAGSESK